MFMMMPTAAYAAVDTSSLVSLTNQDRAAQGLGSVTINPLLVKAAQAKANDMAAKGYFSHTTPEGYSSWHWFKLVGYSYARAGENLAQGYSTASEVETAWLNSPTHRANVMNPAFTEIGIATAVGTYQGKQVIFVAEMFGTPKNVPVAAKPAPAPAAKIVAAAPSAPLRTAPKAPVTAQGTRVLGTEAPTQGAPKAAVSAKKASAPIASVEAEAVTEEVAPAAAAAEISASAPQEKRSRWQVFLSYLTQAYQRFARLSSKIFA